MVDEIGFNIQDMEGWHLFDVQTGNPLSSIDAIVVDSRLHSDPSKISVSVKRTKDYLLEQSKEGREKNYIAPTFLINSSTRFKFDYEDRIMFYYDGENTLSETTGTDAYGLKELDKSNGLTIKSRKFSANNWGRETEFRDIKNII
jgi:hypothetical protein